MSVSSSGSDNGRAAEAFARLAGEAVNSGPAGRDPRAPSFRQIVENLPAAIYTTDAQGRITFYNEAATELWGRSPAIGEEWCGSWRLYRTDGTPMAHAECPMAATLKTGEAVRGVEAVAERPDGSRYTFLPYPTPVLDDEGHLIGAVNMLVDISDRIAAEEASHRLAAIVASSTDAIIGKTLNGIITSWNDAAERLFGYEPEEIIGQSVLTLIPPDRHNEEAEIITRIRSGERVEHYETIRRRKDGTLVDISLTISPIWRADGRIIGASKIARDITERKNAEALHAQQAHRLATLNRVSQIISRDLDLDRIVQAVADMGTELTRARFGAFFYNVADEFSEAYLPYVLSGAPREAFEKFGLPRKTQIFGPTFAGTEVIRSDDIRQDPRYGHNAPHHGTRDGHLPVVSYLAIPVISSSSDVLGGLFFAHDEPGRFGPETETLVSAIAGQAAVAIDNARLHRAAQLEIEQRKKAEDTKELLLHEIKHRVKNTLATVQAMASQTFRRAPPEESEAFVARLHALSEANDLLTEQNWDVVEAGSVVRRAIKPFLEQDRQRIAESGPEATLNPSRALLLSMALHELATNAVKYGALSVDSGKVELTWSLADDDKGAALRLEWRECGGPVVNMPSRKGFGSRMIERGFRGEQGAVSFDYAPTGLTCRLELRL